MCVCVCEREGFREEWLGSMFFGVKDWLKGFRREGVHVCVEGQKVGGVGVRNLFTMA